MAWIAVDQSLIGGKLRNFAKKSKISQNEAIGILVRLWLWALDNADQDGKIVAGDMSDVEEAIRARKPGDVFPAPEAKVLAEPVAAVVGLESPLKSGRSVVALLSEGPASSLELNSRLVKPGDLNNVGGTVAVVSTPGRGTTFTVTLPEHHGKEES